MVTTAHEEKGSSVVAARRFPLPATNLYRLLSDPEYRQAFNARLKQGNRFMAAFYKARILPLLGMGGQLMLLTTRGRKTRQMRDTPIGYFRIDGAIYVFSGWGGDANWYKNILACPDDVYVQVGFRRFQCRPEFIEDPESKRRILQRLVVQDPRGAHLLMGWDPAIDRPETADFALMLEKVFVIRFDPA